MKQESTPHPHTEEPHKPYHHGDLRNALIEAGIAVLAEVGVAGLDLRKLARRVGVSHAAPYRHFVDKSALLVAIAEAGFAQLEAALAIAAAQEDALPVRIRHLIAAYVRFGLEHPELFREMFSSLNILRTEHPALYEASKRCYLLLKGVVERGQADGAVRPTDAHRMSLILWSTTHGLTTLLVEQQLPGERSNPDALEEVLATAVSSLCYGILATPAS